MQTKKAYKEAFSTDKWKLQSVDSILEEKTGVRPPGYGVHRDQLAQEAAVPGGLNEMASPPDGMVIVDSDGNPLSPVREAATCVDATARGMKILKEEAKTGRLGVQVR